MNRRTPLLVLGLGNVLLEDDGVGAAAVALLPIAIEPPTASGSSTAARSDCRCCRISRIADA